MEDCDVEALFKILQPLIDAQITTRLVEFHEALIERRQIEPMPPQHGVTGDCMVHSAQSSNPSQQPDEPL